MRDRLRQKTKNISPCVRHLSTYTNPQHSRTLCANPFSLARFYRIVCGAHSHTRYNASSYHQLNKLAKKRTFFNKLNRSTLHGIGFTFCVASGSSPLRTGVQFCVDLCLEKRQLTISSPLAAVPGRTASGTPFNQRAQPI